MLILRHLLTILLALQIVNPMCQCNGSPGDSACKSKSESPFAPPANKSSCCAAMMEMAHSDSSQDSDSSENPHHSQDKGSHLCMCQKDPNASQDAKVNLPDTPELIDLPELAIIELPDPIKDQPEMRPLVRNENHPPGPDITVLFSVFLI